MSRAVGGPSDVGGRGYRLVPHLRVIPVEQGDGPVATAHEPTGTETVDCHVYRGSQVGCRPRGARQHRVEPGDLRAHVRKLGRGSKRGGPRAHLLRAERRLAEVVYHDRQPGEPLRELWHVVEVAREDARELEHETALSQQLQGSRARWPAGSSEDPAPRESDGEPLAAPAAPPARRAGPPLATGERRSTHAVTAAIQSCSAACANIASVSASVQAAWTRIVRSIPHASSRGRRSEGSKSRAITACSGVIHDIGSRRRSREMLVGIDRQFELASWAEEGEPPASVADAGGSSSGGG